MHMHMLTRLLKHWNAAEDGFINFFFWRTSLDSKHGYRDHTWVVSELWDAKLTSLQQYGGVFFGEQPTFHSWNISILTLKADLVISKKWWKSMLVKSNFSDLDEDGCDILRNFSSNCPIGRWSKAFYENKKIISKQQSWKQLQGLIHSCGPIYIGFSRSLWNIQWTLHRVKDLSPHFGN